MFYGAIEVTYKWHTWKM